MRIFLGWERPAIATVAEQVMQDYRQGSWLDLSQVAVVFPGSRPGRRFLQVLLRRAQQQQLRCLPPKIVTTGNLPELLYTTDRRLAPTWLQEWGWTQALSRLSGEVQSLLMGRRTEQTDFARWQLARRIQQCYQELMGDGWRPADIVRQRPQQFSSDAQRWWRSLVQWEDQYLKILHAQGYADRHDLRWHALSDRLCHCEVNLILVGAVDLRRQVQQMLASVADRVTAFIFAPPTWSDGFDELGCLRPGPWSERQIALSDTQWSIARGPAAVASVVADAVVRWASLSTPGDVTVAVTDDTLVPYLQRASQQRGATARWATGQPIKQTSPWRLLQLLKDWLAHDDDPFTAIQLIRHPDVTAWLIRQGASVLWLEHWDRTAEHVVPSAVGDICTDERLTVCGRGLEQWREQFTGSRPLTQWNQVVARWLADLLQDVVLQGNRPEDARRLAVWDTVARRLRDWSEGPPEMAPAMTAVEALEWQLQQLERESIPSEKDPHAWEMLGWLELLLDDAPHVVVAGFSETSVPGAISPDRAWPVPLPERCQVPHDQLRFARDAYILQTMLSSRNSCHVVVGRVDGMEAPLLPSRLLFLNSAAVAAERWNRLLHDVREEAEVESSGSRPALIEKSRFAVPRLDAYLQPLSTIRVTDFAFYLACPYRFYLGRILNLRPVAHELHELSPIEFGTLAHEVLAAFGEGPFKDADDPQEIETILHELLIRAANRRYGARPRATVQLQLSQLRLRFTRFAVEQARCRREGWRILQVEFPADSRPIPWKVDGQPIGLLGRIDRIDQHEDGKRLRILDYKTSELGKSPRGKHGPDQDGTWTDLQLPLYRPIARGLSLAGSLELGYFHLGKTKAATRIQLADWTAEELASADRTAERVVRDIRAQKFWPPVDPPPPFSETFAAICMDHVRERDQAAH